MLIFLSIFVVVFIAFWDMKDRLNTLDEISANTPSQVELNQNIQNNYRKNIDNMQFDAQKKEEAKTLNDNQKPRAFRNNYDKIKERRNIITNPVD